MKKLLICLFIVSSTLCSSQISQLKIVTKQGDTIKNIAFKRRDLKDPTKNYKLQDEIVFLNQKLETVTMLPSEVKSFSFKFGDEVVTFESKFDKLFAFVMYSNKLKLLRFQKRGYTPVDIYVIERPNGKTSYLEAMGLSRRISLKVIKRELPDCPTTIAKVENDILKIQGEPGILELVQDYETNCY